MPLESPRSVRSRRVALLLAVVLAAVAAGIFLDRETGPTSPAGTAASDVPAMPSPTKSMPSGLVKPFAVDAHAMPRPTAVGPTIKTTPGLVTGFDGKEGTLVIDHAALMSLRPGEYVVTQLGEHTIAHRVTAKEKRDGHTYIPMTVVDPLTGKPLHYQGAFHAYEDGSTNYYFNSDHVSFDVRATNGQPTRFRNFHALPSQDADGDAR
jgi:hypothetical protein